MEFLLMTDVFMQTFRSLYINNGINIGKIKLERQLNKLLMKIKLDKKRDKECYILLKINKLINIMQINNNNPNYIQVMNKEMN